MYSDKVIFGLFACLSVALGQTPAPVQEIPVEGGQTYSLLSPNYPFNYPANSNSTYVFTSPNGTTLSIECPDLSVPCPNDYLTISPSGDPTPAANATKYCRNTPVPLTTSTGNKLAVYFQSGNRNVFGSFFPSYRFRCNVKASNLTGGAGGNGTTSAPLINGVNCTCGIRNSNITQSTRIVGGTETSRGEIPWRVLLNIRMSWIGPNSVCAGTIISPSWVMTAAHCTANLLPGYEIKVIYGAQYSKNDGKTIVSDRYVQNPEFTQSSMDGDMTLVHLPTPLVFDQKSVAPVCLPWSLRNETFDNVTALASGWGTTQPVPVGQTNTNQVSNTLMKVELPVLSSEHCQAQFPTLKYVTSNMLCTYLPGKDTCQGDSGGSIDYQPNQNGSFFGIGVVSFGEGCAQNDHPGVYTKVTNYLNWIQTTTGENYCQA